MRPKTAGGFVRLNASRAVLCTGDVVFIAKHVAEDLLHRELLVTARDPSPVIRALSLLLRCLLLWSRYGWAPLGFLPAV